MRSIGRVSEAPIPFCSQARKTGWDPQRYFVILFFRSLNHGGGLDVDRWLNDTNMNVILAECFGSDIQMSIFVLC